jgi:hypothetical protein
MPASAGGARQQNSASWPARRRRPRSLQIKLTGSPPFVTNHKVLTRKIVLVPGALSPHCIAHSWYMAGAIGG